MNKKRGDILTENIIFIILTLIFFTILVFFIFSRASGNAIKEEELAKQIALIIDAAKPGMTIKINLEDAIKAAEKENYNKNIVTISGNTVTAKFRENGGYSYSFFSNVNADVRPDAKDASGKIKNYVITVREK